MSGERPLIFVHMRQSANNLSQYVAGAGLSKLWGEGASTAEQASGTSACCPASGSHWRACACSHRAAPKQRGRALRGASAGAAPRL